MRHEMKAHQITVDYLLQEKLVDEFTVRMRNGKHNIAYGLFNGKGIADMTKVPVKKHGTIFCTVLFAVASGGDYEIALPLINPRRHELLEPVSHETTEEEFSKKLKHPVNDRWSLYLWENVERVGANTSYTGFARGYNDRLSTPQELQKREEAARNLFLLLPQFVIPKIN